MIPVTYRPDHKGFKDLSNSAFVQGSAVDAARRIATTATRIDRSSRAEYSAGPATVTGGRNNEMRGGASVRDIAGTGGYDRALLTAIEVETEVNP